VDISTALLLVLGVSALVVGAEGLVRGATRLAATFGVSPLVIGLTVVAYGTSAPELTVSVTSSLGGQPAIAVANVVGSNILNVLLILGVTTLISPVAVAQQFVHREVPIMIGVSGLFLWLAYDHDVSRADGIVLILCAVAYTVAAIRLTKKEPAAVRDEYALEFGAAGPAGSSVKIVLSASIFCVIGLGLLVVGAKWLVVAGTTIAAAAGISETVIGLTVIALGTSLPEIATSVLAAFRGERDIAVGNIIGSNIFNLLGIAGISALVAPGGLTVADSMIVFDLPVMVAVAIACLPIFATGHRIDRWEGLLLFGYYVAYTAYLVLDATGHDLLPAFSATMLLFVIPITMLTLAVVTIRAVTARNLIRP
jgi:cation:H+ antiporter